MRSPTALALGRRLGKVPVVVGVCYGFVGNRMLARRSVEAERLLLEGALPQEVDAALVEFGLPMGPFAMMDLAGLDVGWRIRKGRGETAVIEDALCEAGHFGQKTGKGYFRYEAGSRTPIPDPEVERIILDASARLGVARRPISAEEIVERMVFPMINEGARILEEGIATRPGDIDVVWVYGYGWPVWRGGPMYYADGLGLAHLRDRLDFYAERSGDETLRPAALIRRLAAEGTRICSMTQSEEEIGAAAAMAEKLEDEAMKLPTSLRARLARRLIASLDREPADPDIEESWTVEAPRRLEELVNGKVAGIPAEDALRKARAALR